MVNLEKNLIFISDKQFIDEVLTSVKELKKRSDKKEDVDIVINKLKNIKSLCQEKSWSQEPTSLTQ